MAFHLGICDPIHQNLCYTNTLERFNVFVECFVENSAAPAIYEKGVNVNYKSILFYCLPPVSDTSCHHYLLPIMAGSWETTIHSNCVHSYQ